jgi:hypothetical protein
MRLAATVSMAIVQEVGAFEWGLPIQPCVSTLKTVQGGVCQWHCWPFRIIAWYNVPLKSIKALTTCSRCLTGVHMAQPLKATNVTRPALVPAAVLGRLGHPQLVLLHCHMHGPCPPQESPAPAG